MSGEYSLNKTDGTLLTNIYPLETDGPNGISAYRQVSEIKPSYPIIQVSGGVNFQLTGNLASRFPIGTPFTVVGGPNAGNYVTSANSAYFSLPDETHVTVASALPSPLAGGDLVLNAFIINDDLLRLAAPVSERRFTIGSTFNYYNIHAPLDPRVSQSPFTVSKSYLDGSKSVIIPVATITTSTINPGEITYPVPASTCLRLSGRGSINYGENLSENMVKLVENFAGLAPPSGTPLLGQLWYRTTTNAKAMMTWTGAAWSSDISLAEGSLIFRDPQHPTIPTSATMILKGDDETVGLSIRPSVNPAATNALLRVVDNAGTLELLRVEYNGFIRSSNNLEIKGTGDSLIYGRLGIGANGIPTMLKTLTVEGDGIQIKSDTGLNAGLVIQTTDITATSYLDFKIGATLEGNIAIGGNVAGHPLEINSATARNITMVLGGGQVGIGTAVPAVGKKLDVTGDTKITGTIDISGTGKIGGQLDMSTNKIVNVVNPTNAQDVATKNYADSSTSTHAGDFTLHLTSAQNTWIDAITATAAQVNFLVGTTSAVQTQLNAKLDTATGLPAMGAQIDMNSHKIVNVTNPTLAQDAATKSYVDANQNFTTGVRLAFAMAAAPTGWTQDVSDTATDRMLRVVNTAGGGVGGNIIHSPINMNVVPGHTHTMTTGGESADHAHYTTTGTESADHAHYTTTGGISANHTHTFADTSGTESVNHTHTFSDTTSADGSHLHTFSFADSNTGNVGGNALFTGYVNDGPAYNNNSNTVAAHTHTVSGTTSADSTNHTHAISGTTSTVSADHTHSGWSGGRNAAHTHAGWSGGRNTAHTHSGTTDGGGSSNTNWAPRYINMIICTKN